MRVTLTGAAVYRDGQLRREDILIEGNRIAAIVAPGTRLDADSVVDCSGRIVSPGFADAHAHLREPGFPRKETVATATAAAARGGYTVVAAMPNIDPVPDSLEHTLQSLEIYRRDALVHVRAFGAITRGEFGQTLSDMEDIAPYVAAFSDDGKGVQSEELMREAMLRARAVGKPIAAHCEDNTLSGAQSEWRQVERDLRLVSETGCRYHVQHASCRETVELVRRAKSEGLPVTCETAPHYLCLNDNDVSDDGRFVMNPPIRSLQDQLALIEGLRDGAIDIIATDHAPHTALEKSGGFAQSARGVVGLETAFPALYTRLVLTGLIPLERLLETLTAAPRALLGEPPGMTVGSPADITVLDTSTSYKIDPRAFLSKGRSTPFDGWEVRIQPMLTFVEGRLMWNDGG
ncbi:MAG: dihydroorotase [Oscillospiraceae bacterium]|jgi:dihydroorotase|nr:dihydroorotase [Oscillospiraceae bacterium]